jgi:hypothetical protein
MHHLVEHSDGHILITIGSVIEGGVGGCATRVLELAGEVVRHHRRAQRLVGAPPERSREVDVAEQHLATGGRGPGESTVR